MTPTNMRHRPADLLSVASSTGGHSTHSQQNLPSTLFSPDTHPDGSRQTSSTSSAVPKTLAPIMTKETSSGSFAPHITLPPATTTANANVKITATPRKNRARRPPPLSPMSPRSSRSARDAATAPAPLSPHGTFYDVESGLLPALNPPEWGMFDIFPFSLLVKYRTRKGIEMKGKKAARMRAKLRSETVSHNIPLEISLYLSSYVAALQQRKALDPATASELSLSCQIGSQRLIIDHQY
jgi:putative membrane protein